MANIIRPKAYKSTEPSAERVDSIFGDNDLCVIDYKESDDSSEGEVGAEMIRCYEEEERAWRVEQAERATRRMQQVEQAIKAHNYRLGRAAEKEVMATSMTFSIKESREDTRRQAMSHRSRISFTQGPYRR